jgi:folate-dependent tRNA-U54 methylase TrmFO/GidA
MGTELATGVKVFATTLARDREVLGETITRWIADHPDVEILEKQVRQSSDRQFHCLSVTLFYRDRKVA